MHTSRSLTLCLLLPFLIASNAFAVSQKDLLAELHGDNAIVGGQLVAVDNPIAQSTVIVFNQDDRSTCTGALLNNRFVITAAHCLMKNPKNLKIVFSTDGQLALDANTPAALVRHGIATRIHRDFLNEDHKANPLFADLGLILLDAPAPTMAIPVLITDDNLTNGEVLLTAGYGVYSQETQKVAKNDPKLAEAKEKGLGGCDNYGTNCKIFVERMDRKLRVSRTSVAEITKDEFSMDDSNGAGSCHGDSGGPVLMEKDGQIYLVGINSRGDGFGNCGESQNIKVRVGFYIDWIQKTMAEMISAQ